MANKNNKQRRQIEALKAQLATKNNGKSQSTKTFASNQKSFSNNLDISSVFYKKSLFKSLNISLFVIILLLAIYLTEGSWIQYINIGF